MRIGVLILDDVFDSGLATVLDAFELGEGLRARIRPRLPPLVVTTIGVRSRVTTHRGHVVVPERRVETVGDLDCLVVPGLFAVTAQDVDAALGRRDVQEAVAFLRRQGPRRLTIASACSGAFLAAEAGILDGHRVTTSWWLAPAFRDRYPAIDLREENMVLRDRRRVTAGAALGHVDLALFLVAQQSEELSRTLAQYLSSEPRSSQAKFVIPEHLTRIDPTLDRFERFARRHLARGFTMLDAARAAGTSQRSLERTVRRVLGRSPVSFLQDLRVDVAVRLLRTSDRTVDDIASAVGYDDGTTLRTLLRRKLGRGVRELRQS